MWTSNDNESNNYDQLVVAEWNVQEVLNNIEELIFLNSQFNTAVLYICEHWLSIEKISDIAIDRFYLASANFRL